MIIITVIGVQIKAYRLVFRSNGTVDAYSTHQGEGGHGFANRSPIPLKDIAEIIDD